MCAAEVAIKFSSLETIRDISRREQSSLSKAAEIYEKNKKKSAENATVDNEIES